MSPSKVTKKTDVAAPAAAAQPEKTEQVNNGADAAVDVENAGSDDEEEPKEETTKSKAEQSSALDKLTDVVEEKQMDGNKMKQAFEALQKQAEADKEAERTREKQLAAVKVKKEDVELVAREMELTVAQADRKLREAEGDVVACLKAMLA